MPELIEIASIGSSLHPFVGEAGQVSKISRGLLIGSGRGQGSGLNPTLCGDGDSADELGLKVGLKLSYHRPFFT